MRFSSKMTRVSKKWRGALIYLALFGVAPMAFGAGTEIRSVSTFNELRSAISEFNGNTGSNFKIVLTGNIQLSGELPAITGNSDLKGESSGALTIEGNGYSINGANAYRGLYIDSSDSESVITVSNVNFTNCLAKGGDGGDGASAGGGGMGAGAAIYAFSGDVVLSNVSAYNNTAVGGNGGTVQYGSSAYAGGGGIGGDGGDGVINETGAANGGGIFTDGDNSSSEVLAGDGGETSPEHLESYGHKEGGTTPVGGHSLAGGGGGGSTAIGGDGGFGGGGGAGAQYGGNGGFGGGGAGGANATTAGSGGFGAGDGGYQDAVTSEVFQDTQGGGTGGGGAALGAAIFVAPNANVTVAVTKNTSDEIYGNSLKAGVGGGNAEDGEAIGTGLFLLNDLTIEVAEGGVYTISDSIGGYAGSSEVQADSDGLYDNMSGIVKKGEGTLVLNNGSSSYTGATTVEGGTLQANQVGAISTYSDLNIKGEGKVVLNANQSIQDLSGASDATLDIGTHTLTVAGNDDETVYNGHIVGTGTLFKDGSSVLALGGDNRALGQTTGFTTNLHSGTIRVLNGNAFGVGNIVYSRTDTNDQSAALDFASGIAVDNNIILSGNTVSMRLTGDSAELNGRLYTNSSQASEIILDLNSGETLSLNNTGVLTDGNDVAYYGGNGNTISNYLLKSGNLSVKTDSFTKSDVRYWYNAIGGGSIENAGDNNLSFILNSDDSEAGLKFSNSMVLDSGWLGITPVLTDDTSELVKNITYSGKTSGNGGLRLDIGKDATMYLTGTFGHGYTDIKSGTLDVSGASGSQINLGGLSSKGEGAIVAGEKDLIVKFDSSDLEYTGKIVGEGDGATIYKDGSGTWAMNLTNDSNVESVQVKGGVFSLGANHYEGGVYGSNDFGIVLSKSGAFRLVTDDGAYLKLNNFDASNGGAIDLGEYDELELTGTNKVTDIAANLYGSGWLYLDNVTDDKGSVRAWTLSGDNSAWEGVIAAYDSSAIITLASANAGSINSKINMGGYGLLNVQKSTNLGGFNFDHNATINVSSGATLALNKLTSNAAYLDDSLATISGGGSVRLNKGAASSYYGATLVDGSSLILNGDNTVDDESSVARRLTTLANGGSLVMDYSGDTYSENVGSLWGSAIAIDGIGGITVNNIASNANVELNDNISFVGAGSNQLNFNSVNAKVLLRNQIEGMGSLVKSGNGTLILDGFGVFQEADVQNGTLQLGTSSSDVNDQLSAALVAINGGSVTGWTDSFGALALNSGSLDLSGARTINLTGTGTVFSMNGGLLNIDVEDENTYTNFKVVDEDSNVDIKDGSVYVDTATSGVVLEQGARLTIVDASAGNLSVDKSKLMIYDDYAGKRFVVDTSSIADGKFDLVLKNNSYSDYAQTANQRSVARYLDDWMDSGTWDPSLNDFFANLENDVAIDSGVMDQLTGELRFSAFNAQLQSRNFIRQTLTRSILPSGVSTSETLSSSALRGQSWEYGEGENGLAGWANAFGATGDVNSHIGTTGYDYSLMGGIIGVELGSRSTNQFGFYYSYNNTDVNAKSPMGKVKVGDNLFGLYLRASDDWGYTLGTGTLGVANYKHERSIVLSNYAAQSFNGKTDGWSGSAYLERGFTFQLPASQLQPFAGVQYTYLEADAFTENGSLDGLQLSTNKSDYSSLQGLIGLRWLRSVILANGVFDFDAHINWTHEFLDADAEGLVTMAGGPDGTFRVIGNGIGRDWIYAGLGGTMAMYQNVDLFGGADVQTNDYATLINGNFGVKVKW